MFDITISRTEEYPEKWELTADGEGTGTIQIRRLTECKGIAFVFGFESDSDHRADVANALLSKIIANAPKHNIGLLLAKTRAGSPLAQTLESLDFRPFTQFENPNTGNTLQMYSKAL